MTRVLWLAGPQWRALSASLCGAALALAIAAGPRALAAPSATVLFVNDSAPDGLVAHWKFDEVGASTVRDFVGAEAAALQNGASVQAGPLPTVTFPNSGALVLDGVNDRVAISDTAALNLAASFSLLGWLRRTSPGSFDAIYDSGDQTNQWWVFVADGTAGKDNKLGFGVRGFVETYGTQPITDSSWHHFAVVKNGDGAANLSFFVDGSARGTASVGSLTTPTGTKYIGVLQEGVNFLAPFGGSLDDIRLYNRALSAAEVLRLAQGHGCVFDGSSWPVAMRELQCALSEASPGDDIWLANGTYRAGTNREMSFNLRDGVNLFGGFTANPAIPSQRVAFNPLAPSTLLLGDLNGDDNPATLANYADNTRQLLVVPPGASLLLDRFGVRGGNADGRFTETVGYGGGLFVGLGASVQLNQLAFLSNKASTEGGGVFSQAPMAISATTFISNSSGNQGGGLGITSTLQLTNSVFLSNTSNFGGAAHVLTATITGGMFRNNHANVFHGGAIYSEADLEVRGPAAFTLNSAGFSGGAIYAAAPLTVTAGSFVSNTVTTFSGGALEVLTRTFVQSSSFSGNVARDRGGALSAGGPSVVANSDFRANQVAGINCFPVTGCSAGDGGAIFVLGPLNVTSSTLLSNTARLVGGAIAVQGPVLVTLSELNGNVAGKANDTPNPGRGGAIFASQGLTLSFSTVATNSATVVGGGLSVTGTALIVNTNFVSNTAQSGGGIQHGGGSVQVAGSLFAGNVVTSGGAGLSLTGSSADLVNNTFAGRAANAHAAVSSNGSNLTVRNTLFANYANSVLVDMSTPLTYSFNLFFSTPLPNAGTDSGHNLTANPLFVDSPGGDFRLTQASPAVDAGLDAAVPSFLSVDLEGARRIADLPGVGVLVSGVPQRVDIGAYEYQPPTIFLPVIVR